MAGLTVITGANGGLGLAVIEALKPISDRILGVAGAQQDPDHLRSIADVDWARADLTQPEDVDDLWREIDGRGLPVTTLVNLAGGFAPGRLTDTTAEAYRHMLALNLDTAWWSCRAAAARMAAHGQGGAIVNVGSRSALVREGGAAAYAIAKAAVLKLTETLAEELKGQGIRVNAVIPAIIDTPANRAWMTPADLDRAVSPRAIARVIAFLAGPDAEAVTGALVPVYGRF